MGLNLLIALPVLVASWVGVIAVGRAGRTAAWWSMLVGTVLTTLGSLGSLLWILGISVNGIGGPGGNNWVVLMSIVSAIAMLGSLLFAVGFAMHGLRLKRVVERTEELESIIAAQQEQLARSERA